MIDKVTITTCVENKSMKQSKNLEIALSAC